jgi:RNA exonuclease 1
MPVAKKYKLFSKSSDGDGQPVCAFFSSPEGCRSGDKCRFLHPKNEAEPSTISAMEVSETASVVSSESEGEVRTKVKNVEKVKNVDPFVQADSNAEKHQVNDKGKEPKKKNKRKSSLGTSGEDIFANPKKRSPPITGGTNDKTPNKKPRQAVAVGTNDKTPNKKPRQAVAVGKNTNERPALNASPDFRGFASNLPIASFSIGEDVDGLVSKADKTQPPPGKPAAKELSSSKKEDSLPFPTSTEVGRKWQKAVLKSREHDRYTNSFNFPKYKDMNKAAGITAEWIKAKPFGSWCASNPQAIAIDCEMCESKDPLTGAKNAKALCRFSVVNAENPEEVLMDTLVKPSWPVTDYRTRINGISKENLENVEFTLRHAQAFMMALCSEETVIVGHAVQNDLVALNMEHHCVADSSFLFHANDSTSASVSLKDLVASIFQKVMPDTHDSVNDARKALECVVHWVTKDGNVDAIERTPRHKGHQLFVHRIPKQCQAQHLINMLLKHTSVEPTEVDVIEYSGESGKTHVTFTSTRHASLAFDTLEGASEEDKSGRLQKKVYLRNGGYVRVRKMVFANRGNVTPKKTPTK